VVEIGIHLPHMRSALTLAHRALSLEEVPVGAVVVLAGKIVGKGYNQSICKSDPTAHAEILALRQAAKTVGNYRLTSATLYCTLEPCAMCAGALLLARVKLLVYGAMDIKAGAVHSHFNLLQTNFLNHRVEVIPGVMADESAELLKEFFRLKRIKARG
jgi:tRNA(adenine34) deaminase